MYIVNHGNVYVYKPFVLYLEIQLSFTFLKAFKLRPCLAFGIVLIIQLATCPCLAWIQGCGYVNCNLSWPHELGPWIALTSFGCSGPTGVPMERPMLPCRCICEACSGAWTIQVPFVVKCVLGLWLEQRLVLKLIIRWLLLDFCSNVASVVDAITRKYWWNTE